MSQRTVMPYSATPPKPAIRRSSSGSVSAATSRTGANGTRSPATVTPDSAGSSGSILRPSMPTTVWPSFSRWCASVNPAGPMPTTSTRFPVAGNGSGRRRLRGFHRVKQAVDLETPGQREHVLQDARLGLWHVDRIGLLVDAALHAVVADPVAGAGDQRIVDAHDRERPDRPAVGAELLELGDLLLERAAGQHDAERASAERNVLRRAVGGLLLGQPARTRILALLVAPDAVMRFAERGRQVHSGIGQREALAAPQVIAGVFPRGDAVHMRRFERHEPQVVELARRAKQDSAVVRGAPLGRVRRPRGIARRRVERRGVRRLVLLPARDRVGERELRERFAHRRLDRAPQGRRRRSARPPRPCERSSPGAGRRAA